jgi:hypothetical protein
MSGFSSDPLNFVRKYPQLPAAAYLSVEEIMEVFPQDHPIIFYYPTVPSRSRDQNTIALLKHFPNSAMLMEKPSHNTATEARAFLEELG